MAGMQNQFAFFKAWMKLQDEVANIEHVYVLEPDHTIEQWPGSESHSIPTLFLSVDLHMRLKTGPDQYLDLQPREAVAIRAGAVHEHLKSRHLGMYYTQGFLETYSDIRLVDQEQTFKGSVDRDPLWDKFHALMDEVEDEQRCIALADFLHCVDIESMSTERVDHPGALRMHEFIRRNAHLDISIQDIIDASGLADAQAFAVYKKAFELTPLHHLLKRRVHMAMAYLRSGMDRASVVEQSGFQSSRQMNRAFHRFAGMSPRDWLRSVKNA